MHKDIKDFKTQLRGRQLELQKKKNKNSFYKQNNNSHVLHACLHISLSFLHYDVKMPNFAFYGVRKQATTNWFLFLNMNIVPRNLR